MLRSKGFDRSIRDMSDLTPAEPEALPPLHSRIGILLFEPGRLFAMLGRDPAIWGALFLGAFLASLASALLPVDVWMETARIQFQQTGQELPADPLVMARVTKVVGVFGTLIFWPILALLTAGVLALLFLFGMAYEGGFRQYFSVTVHALLIPALAALLLVPLKIITTDAAFSITLADLFFFLEEGFLFRFLSLMEFFNLWVYVLLGIGVWALDPRRSLRVSIGASLGVAILFSLLIAAFTG